LTRFDLTETSRLRSARRTLRLHWLLRALFGLGIAALGLWVAYFVIMSRWTAISATMAGIAVVACILFGWVVIMTGPGAAFMEINEAEVGLGFAGGRIWKREWNDGKFGLNVFQAHSAEADGSRIQLIQFGSGVWPVTSYLTTAAFDALLHEAERQGLSVIARPLSRGEWTWYRITQRPGERITQ
jgi:hypothetical protein